MDQKDAKILQKNYVRLVENLETRNISSYLYQEGVLSDDDKEKIHAALGTSKEKAETLLDILKRRKNGLKMLIKALLVSSVQTFLGNELLEIVEWNKEEMDGFKLELENKIDHQQMLEANLAALKQENRQLRANYDEIFKNFQEKEDKVKVLTQQLTEKNDACKTSRREEEKSETMKQECVHHLRTRRNAISLGRGGRVLYEKLQKSEILKQENHYLNIQISLLAQQNAIMSFHKGGRVLYESHLNLEDLHKKPPLSARQKKSSTL